MAGFFHDEQGNRSLGRVFFAAHVTLNWFWIHKLLSGAWTVPGESSVLQIVVGTLDVAILLSLAAWVAGPRNVQYLAPLFSAVGSLAGGVAGKVSSWASSSSWVGSSPESIGGPSPDYERPEDLTLDSNPSFSEADEP